MIVVADASPLIFLGKIDRLRLIHELYGNEIRVPRSVAEEVVSEDTDPIERDRLKSFLRQCRVQTVRRPTSFATAMSRADNEALTLAVRTNAHVLLCDEKLTRRMAEIHGIRPMGTLGVLLNATQRKLIASCDARILLDQLIALHHFRISITVYQTAIRMLEEMS